MGELVEVVLGLLGFGGGMAVGTKIGTAVGTGLRPVAKAAVKAGLAAAEGFQIGAGSAARTAQDAAGSAARTAQQAIGGAGATVRQTVNRGTESVQHVVAEARQERAGAGTASEATAAPTARKRPTSRSNRDRVQRIEVAHSLEEATRPNGPSAPAEGTPPEA